MELSITRVHKDANAFIVAGKRLLELSEKLEINPAIGTQGASMLLKECQNAEQDLEAKRMEIVKPANDFVRETNALFKETASSILTAKNIVKTKILAYNQEQERIRREAEEKALAEERARLRKLEEERLERERIEALKREEEEKKLKAEQERLRKLEEERLQKELEARKASEEEQNKLKAEAEKQRLERERLENEKLEIERQKRESEEERRKLAEEKDLMEKNRLAEEALKTKEATLKVKGIVKRWSWEIISENDIPRAFCSPDTVKINKAIKEGARVIDGLRIFEVNDVR